MTKPYGRIYKNKTNVSITPTDVYNLYPVGSIYLSVNSTNPSNYFGGTWERLSGGYLYATSSDVLGKTPYTGWGAQSTSLTIDQIPSHHHSNNSIVWDDTNGLGYTWWIGANNVKCGAMKVNNDEDGIVAPWMGHGNFTTSSTGGTQGHTHNIATIDVWIWKRVA